MELRDCRWRDVSPDYYGRLQEFECARGSDRSFIGAMRRHHRYYPVWELEVQSTIRAFHKPNPESQWAQICVKPDDAHHLEVIYSFVWFGILRGTFKDNNGVYTIGYIARSLDAAGCHFGDFTLKHALWLLAQDQHRSGREPMTAARIDPRNEASTALF